jgi:[ribosomal protein S5]-alanine N-acetyltransferase
VIETARLAVSRLSDDDAEFILGLVNEPSFLHYIGDRGVRTLEDARRYIQQGPVAGYAKYGYGLMRIGLKPAGTPIGICGVLRRDTLPDPDLGFSLLPAYWSKGYAPRARRARARARARDHDDRQRSLDPAARQARLPLRATRQARQRSDRTAAVRV